jgi:ABC-2 type transport system permease protein
LLISLDEIRLTPQEQDFRDGFLPVAVMLEGSFESAFRNRMLNGLFPDTAVNFLETGQPSSILVVSDADVIRNDYRPTPKGVMITPLGFDRYTSQTYGNKEFIVNAIQYMTGHKGLIQLRSCEIKIRLLDKAKLKRDQHKWVLINTVIPPLVVIIAGLLFNWFRRKKNSGI